ncbi:MAG: hypothetical protein HY901_06655 [Deltaproteobacteria bacterium]|nr:hypothetical protein [Deltaproteobacteria bacterium]
MKKTMAVAVSLMGMLSSSWAKAETSATGSLALLDRPLVLRESEIAPSVRTEITNASIHGVNGTGASLVIGADVGLTDSLQVGMAIGMPLIPNPDFGAVVGSGVWGMHEAYGARLDIAYSRDLSTDFSDSSSRSAVHVGLGLPVKLTLSPILAVVSGGTAASRFGRFLNKAASNGPFTVSTFSLTPVFGSDLVTYSHSSFEESSSDGVTLNLPLGLQVQPHERFALALRTGYVLSYASSSSSAGILGSISTSATAHYLPMEIEAVASVLPQLDVGASFGLMGALSSSLSFGSSSLSLDTGYADIRMITVFAQGRF